jgi:hypothetical protein
VQDIVKASIEDLINVPGVGDVTSQKIYLAAVQHMEAVEEKKKRDAQAAPAPAAPAAVVVEEISLPPPAPAKAAIVIEEEAAIELPPMERVTEPAKEERQKEERPKEERPKEREKEPQPVAAEAEEPVAAASEGKPGNYLDEIEAMESELSSGWDDDEDEPKET